MGRKLLKSKSHAAQNIEDWRNYFISFV